MRTILILIILLNLLLPACRQEPLPTRATAIEKPVENTISTMVMGQKKVTSTIGIYEAMARGITYNITNRFTMLDEILTQPQIDVPYFALLPQLTAEAGYYSRTKYSPSSNSALDSSTADYQPLTTSTSQGRNRYTTDVDVMWNVLDFSLTYLQTKQQTTRTILSEELQRKAVQNILSAIRSAYWRAVGSDQLLTPMTKLLNQTNAALENAKQLEAQLVKPFLEMLQYKKALLENARLLWGLIQELKNARSELTTLIHLSPGTPYHLTASAPTNIPIPKISLPLEDMLREALLNRPELQKKDSKTKITLRTAQENLLEMLPSIILDVTYTAKTNNDNTYTPWVETGAYMSMGIFTLFSKPALLKTIEPRYTADEMYRKVTSIVVMTQVHLAYQTYIQSLEECNHFNKLEKIKKQIDTKMRVAEKPDLKAQLMVIKTKTNLLMTRMRYYTAYADLQNALGRIYNSMGLDFLSTAVSEHDTDTTPMTKKLELFFSQTALRHVCPDFVPPSQVVLSAVSPSAPKKSQNTLPDKGYRAVITADRLNFRTRPNMKAPMAAGRLFQGAVFPVLSRTKGWVKLDNQGIHGWVSERFVTIEPK